MQEPDMVSVKNAPFLKRIRSSLLYRIKRLLDLNELWYICQSLDDGLRLVLRIQSPDGRDTVLDIRAPKYTIQEHPYSTSLWDSLGLPNRYSPTLPGRNLRYRYAKSNNTLAAEPLRMPLSGAWVLDTRPV